MFCVCICNFICDKYYNKTDEDIYLRFHFFPFFYSNIYRPKYMITEKRNGFRRIMALLVRSFSPSDVGTYHCVSTNSLGRAEGTLRLYGKIIFVFYMICLVSIYSRTFFMGFIFFVDDVINDFGNLINFLICGRKNHVFT